MSTQAQHKRIVIAGAGHAAGQLVASLQQKKFAGDIVLVGDETFLPYQRPPLSKKFLAGEMPAERLFFRPASFYESAGVDVRLHTRVSSIDRLAKSLITEVGDELSYDSLVLATGSRARIIPVPGHDLDGVHYLRSIDDVHNIQATLKHAKRIVIIGAGYIGLEVAAVMRQIGLDVTVIEMADRVMSRVVSPQISAFFHEEHVARGVKLELSTSLRAYVGEDKVRAVETDDGRSFDTDLVIVGVGILPNTALAEAAGLAVGNGIVVDDRCRSSDSDIYAIGDCTSHPSHIYGRNLRLESVHNAIEQAKTAAANICGEDLAYSQVPWFWSDQYDLKLQIAGLSEGYDDVVIRGDATQRSFACLYLKNDQLIAIDAINSPRDFIQAKPLIANGSRPDRQQLANTEIMLKDLA
ncbi:MAG: FAD-dependent oxidoreductase [Proteobacteria bacterium]|nr:FAD-dependent oxidoreductase [Pseudomonadota bacterium]